MTTNTTSHEWQSLFVGREHEMQTLQDAYERLLPVNDNYIEIISLIGDSGIGKTRIVQQFYTWLSQYHDLRDPHGYWPDFLESSGGNLRVNPNYRSYSKIKQGHPNMPFLWWGIRCNNHNKGRNRREHQHCAIQDNQPKLEEHLQAIYQKKEDKQSIDKSINLVKSTAALIPAVGGVLGLYDAVKETYSYLKEGKKNIKKTKAAIGRLSPSWNVDEEEDEDEGYQNIVEDEFNDDFDQLIDDIGQRIYKKNKGGRPLLPIVMVVDDAQWIDEQSIKFLQKLIERACKGKWRLMLLFTHWQSEWSFDELRCVGIPQFIQTSLNENVTINQCQVCNIPELTPIIRSAFPGIPLNQASFILEKAGGNPLVLHELLLFLKSRPRLFLDRDTTQALTEKSIETLLRKRSEVESLVEDRFFDFPNKHQDLLSLVSYLGGRVPKTILEMLSPLIVELDLNDVLMEVEGSYQFIVIDDDNYIEFPQTVYQTIAYSNWKDVGISSTQINQVLVSSLQKYFIDTDYRWNPEDENLIQFSIDFIEESEQTASILIHLYCLLYGQIIKHKNRNSQDVMRIIINLYLLFNRFDEVLTDYPLYLDDYFQMVGFLNQQKAFQEAGNVLSLIDGNFEMTVLEKVYFNHLNIILVSFDKNLDSAKNWLECNEALIETTELKDNRYIIVRHHQQKARIYLQFNDLKNVETSLNIIIEKLDDNIIQGNKSLLEIKSRALSELARITKHPTKPLIFMDQARLIDKKIYEEDPSNVANLIYFSVSTGRLSKIFLQQKRLSDAREVLAETIPLLQEKLLNITDNTMLLITGIVTTNKMVSIESQNDNYQAAIELVGLCESYLGKLTAVDEKNYFKIVIFTLQSKFYLAEKLEYVGCMKQTCERINHLKNYFLDEKEKFQYVQLVYFRLRKKLAEIEGDTKIHGRILSKQISLVEGQLAIDDTMDITHLSFLYSEKADLLEKHSNYQNAVDYRLRLTQLEEKKFDPKLMGVNTAFGLSRIAWLFAKLNNNQQAHYYYLKALDIFNNPECTAQLGHFEFVNKKAMILGYFSHFFESIKDIKQAYFYRRQEFDLLTMAINEGDSDNLRRDRIFSSLRLCEYSIGLGNIDEAMSIFTHLYDDSEQISKTQRYILSEMLADLLFVKYNDEAYENKAEFEPIAIQFSILEWFYRAANRNAIKRKSYEVSLKFLNALSQLFETLTLDKSIVDNEISKREIHFQLAEVEIEVNDLKKAKYNICEYLNLAPNLQNSNPKKYTTVLSRLMFVCEGINDRDCLNNTVQIAIDTGVDGNLFYLTSRFFESKGMLEKSVQYRIKHFYLLDDFCKKNSSSVNKQDRNKALTYIRTTAFDMGDYQTAMKFLRIHLADHLSLSEKNKKFLTFLLNSIYDCALQLSLSDQQQYVIDIANKYNIIIKNLSEKLVSELASCSLPVEVKHAIKEVLDAYNPTIHQVFTPISFLIERDEKLSNSYCHLLTIGNDIPVFTVFIADYFSELLLSGRDSSVREYGRKIILHLNLSWECSSFTQLRAERMYKERAFLPFYSNNKLLNKALKKWFKENRDNISEQTIVDLKGINSILKFYTKQTYYDRGHLMQFVDKCIVVFGEIQDNIDSLSFVPEIYTEYLTLTKKLAKKVKHAEVIAQIDDLQGWLNTYVQNKNDHQDLLSRAKDIKISNETYLSEQLEKPCYEVSEFIDKSSPIEEMYTNFVENLKSLVNLYDDLTEEVRATYFSNIHSSILFLIEIHDHPLQKSFLKKIKNRLSERRKKIKDEQQQLRYFLNKMKELATNGLDSYGSKEYGDIAHLLSLVHHDSSMINNAYLINLSANNKGVVQTIALLVHERKSGGDYQKLLEQISDHLTDSFIAAESNVNLLDLKEIEGLIKDVVAYMQQNKLNDLSVFFENQEKRIKSTMKRLIAEKIS
jgi:uncharacterized coiled-coil protein SlyX